MRAASSAVSGLSRNNDYRNAGTFTNVLPETHVGSAILDSAGGTDLMPRAEPSPLIMVRRLTTDDDAPRLAREFVSDVLDRLDGAADHRRDDLALVVSEMVSNAVLHGPSGEVDFRVIATDQMVRVEVKDGGVVPFGVNHDGADHLGLGLIDEFSDRHAIEHNPSTVVWCEFDLAA